MEAERSSKSSVNFYQTNRGHIPEGSTLHNHQLRFNTLYLCLQSSAREWGPQGGHYWGRHDLSAPGAPPGWVSAPGRLQPASTPQRGDPYNVGDIA
jgi:hypothetical protein